MDHKEGRLQLEQTSAAAARGGVTVVERRLLESLLETAGNPPIRIRLWGGEEIVAGTAAPVATMVIRDRGALMRMLVNPEVYPADDYSDGRIEIEGDLVSFLEHVFRGLDNLPDKSLKARFLRWMNKPRANTLSGSKENIHHHYDLGNEFYRLWLDTARMQYTCAYYPHPGMSIEEAQIAKLDHVARKLELKPGQVVFEAGCGWGGLARHFAQHYGVTVKAYNISQEQVKFARERAKQEGLDGKVEYILDDYRTMQGECDVFVSVGMLEHVGVDNYPVLGDVIHRVLKPHGRGLIHSIGRNKPAPMNAWTEKRIFPGAYPATLAEMMRILEGHQFSVLDVENLRLHYAHTLEAWLNRYEAHIDDVRKMYDERFVRMWRMYLAASQASFLTGALQLFQIVFARPQDNTIPMNREHLYPR
ncbi:MAG: cyclopropane-fatty-acyl-phospholipid synthase family protein [Burkholderiales bacterium]|nr:cyclopropane-fatty-acyl-phospholipid synthase family protein [Burkholderiales bacterium]